jgi:hypothetical protein
MRRILIGLILTLAALAFGHQAAQASSFSVQNDHLIVPNKRIGPVALGMSDKDLFKLFIPQGTATLGKWTVYDYGEFRIFVDKGTHKVDAIWLHQFDRDAYSYHTAEGLKLGSSMQDILAALGPPEIVKGNNFFGNATTDVKYNAGNLIFDFDKLGASMADAPTRSVQSIKIQSPSVGKNLFGE